MGTRIFRVWCATRIISGCFLRYVTCGAMPNYWNQKFLLSVGVSTTARYPRKPVESRKQQRPSLRISWETRVSSGIFSERSMKMWSWMADQHPIISNLAETSATIWIPHQERARKDTFHGSLLIPGVLGGSVVYVKLIDEFLRRVWMSGQTTHHYIVWLRLRLLLTPGPFTFSQLQKMKKIKKKLHTYMTDNKGIDRQTWLHTLQKWLKNWRRFIIRGWYSERIEYQLIIIDKRGTKKGRING